MARAADPLLASALLASEEESRAQELPLGTGCKAIDHALGDGLRYGETTCISAPPDCGARDLSTSLLITHLLSSPRATATFIDSALAFDVRALHQTLCGRLAAEADASGSAAAVLDRVRIMKVFDAVGLAESLTELRETLDDASQSRLEKAGTRLRSTIADSQDGDEMLDDPAPTAPQQDRLTASPGMLVIDTITQPFAPVLKTNHIQAQALLATFLRTLSHLTQTHNLCTLLINDAYTSRTPREDPPSIFASCNLQPALGKAFAATLDTHMLLHALPRRPGDAAAMYGDADGRPRVAAPDTVSVVEILQDRNGGRVGRWAAFTVRGNGALEGAS